MAFDESTCWLVRAGSRARYATEFVAHAVVSVAWDWTGIGDLAQQSDAEIFLTLEDAGHPKAADDLRDLRIFTARMSPGDVVVVPDPAAGDLLFGQILGDYRYDPGAGDHRHARPTRWFGRLATAQADDFLVAGTTNTRLMLRRLPEQLHWQRLSSEVDDFLGRDPTDVPRIARRSQGGAGTVRKRTGVAMKPTKTLVPDRLCPSCGLLRSPSLFLGADEYCRDCA
ncbi:MAG: hypothetical protein ACR2HR_07930 [Euzebya sp.]